MPHADRAAKLALPLVLSIALLLAPAALRAGEVGTKIVGGTDAESGEYPWQVALEKKGNSPNSLFQLTCGGTLVAEMRVVTAAHCMSGSASNYRVRVGSHLLESGGTPIGVSSYSVHPQFSSSTLRNDAAVLVLASSGTTGGGEVLQLIGEEGSADDAFWQPGDMLAISGWGTTTSGGDLADRLQEAQVPRVADTTCDDPDWYGSDFHAATMVCAGLEEGGVDTCQGDSGGPLAAPTQSTFPNPQDDPSQWRLAGITSWGFGCAEPQQPGVYTRVAAPGIRNWILSQLGTVTQFTLSVDLQGSGGGTVNLDPPNVNCTSDCSRSYATGTPVTLTATAQSGSTFDGWGGPCSSATTNECPVTMDQNLNVTATFTSTASPPPDDEPPPPDDDPPPPDDEPPPPDDEPPPPDDEPSEPTAPFAPDLDDPLEELDDVPPTAAITSNRLRMNRRGVVRIRLACGESEDCQGKARLRMRSRADASAAALRTAGRKAFEIAAGDDKRVRLRLKKWARRLVRREGKVRVKLIVVVKDEAGNRRKLRKKLTLRAAK